MRLKLAAAALLLLSSAKLGTCAGSYEVNWDSLDRRLMPAWTLIFAVNKIRHAGGFRIRDVKPSAGTEITILGRGREGEVPGGRRRTADDIASAARDHTTALRYGPSHYPCAVKRVAGARTPLLSPRVGGSWRGGLRVQLGEESKNE
jgi:hypothetical protein